MFYEKTLMKLVVEAFIANNQEKVTEEVEYLIMSVGTSYGPLVLSIKLLKPGRILFLYTEKTKRILNKVIEYCGLKIMDIEMTKVNETDPSGTRV